MIDRNELIAKLKARIVDIFELPDEGAFETTVLIGPETSLSSLKLVEFLLEVEELMEDEYNVEFDWTSDSVLSMNNSILKTFGTLVDHLHGLAASGK